MHSVFDPHSPQARVVATLWWAMFGVGGAVWLIVIALMFASVARTRSTSDDVVVEPPRVRRLVTLGIGISFIVLVGFLVYDFGVDRALVPLQREALTIEVTGHQWWWEVQYDDSIPSRRLTTANEIHVPVGRLVRVKLRAADVIHSFWAPNLGGKRDLIPGYEQSFWFQADTPGVYRGQCAEFCGMQHAKMAFLIVAHAPSEFATWYATASAPHASPADSVIANGERVFLTGGCSLCHAIAGTQAWATIGPSLSHIGSRRTLAAGTLRNTRENLMGWIVNPQAIKPGVKMPAIPLQPSQLTAVVAYLESLR